MVPSIILAYAWSVLQLTLLGSLARTVRIRTVFAAMAAGLYLCVPLTVALQVGWTGLAARWLDIPVQPLVRIAAYSVDPFLEELMKMLPLLLLLRVPLIRRQWAFTDLVLIAAATGAGFGLAEDLYRFGTAADHARSTASGWTLVFSEGYLLVPSLGRVLTSWLPVGVFEPSDMARLNLHLVWSAVGGLAVGLAVFKRTGWARLAALALYVCISLDHAASNVTHLESTWLVFLAWPLRAMKHVRWLMPVAALAAAWWYDGERQGTRRSLQPRLDVEQSASSPLKGLLGAASSRLPWSLLCVDGFVRMRRAFQTEQAAGTAQADTLSALIATEQNRVNGELTRLRTHPMTAWSRTRALDFARRAIRRPTVILWLIVMTPSLLWFIIGGWPQTAALQAFMQQPWVSKLLFPLSVLAQAWISWRTVAGLRNWSQHRSASIGDEAALVGLRVACGMGAVCLGVFSLLRILAGALPASSILASLHAQDAANKLTPGSGSALAAGAGAFAAPPPSVDLPAPSVNPPAAAPAQAPSDAENGGGARRTQSPANRHAAAPAANTVDAEAAARANAEQADAEAVDAQQRRRDAQNATLSADVKKALGAENDPSVVAAQARARSAHDAVEAADAKAIDDLNDPWSGKSANRIAADEARAESRAADANQIAAENAAQQKLDDNAAAADAAEKQADADAAAAEANAERATANANAQAQAAQTAADQKAAAQQRAADPQGYAADQAANAAAEAQKRADDAFFDTSDPSGKAYHEASASAVLARQRADAARAAADAAKAARETNAAGNAPSGWKPRKS